MLKKLAALLMAAAMLLSMTAAGAETAQAPVTISFYSTQAGVDDATVALLDEFMAQHPGITVEYLSLRRRSAGRVAGALLCRHRSHRVSAGRGADP